MKTFTAKQLSNRPAEIFREADKEGSVKINHDRYPDVVFVLEARERGAGSPINNYIPTHDHVISRIDLVAAMSPKELRFMELTRVEADAVNISSGVKHLCFRGVDISIVAKVDA